MFTLGEECPFFPRWVEALSAWLSREGAVGSDDICCSLVIISTTLPGTLWVSWQWYGGQSKPTEQLRSQQPFQGLCGAGEITMSAACSPQGLPHLPALSTPSSRFKGLCSSRVAHIPSSTIFRGDFLTARVRINALWSNINLQKIVLIFPA